VVPVDPQGSVYGRSGLRPPHIDPQFQEALGNGVAVLDGQPVDFVGLNPLFCVVEVLAISPGNVRQNGND
jgi:hypothetical protein